MTLSRHVQVFLEHVYIMRLCACAYVCVLHDRHISSGYLLCSLQNSFSALTLLVGRQEGNPACKKTGCWFVVGDDLTGALHDL